MVLLAFTARRERDLVTAMRGSATVKLPGARPRADELDRDE